MCGFAGIWAGGIERPQIEAAIARMTTAMAHRGPDDAGVEILAVRPGLLALGARRLAIQDLSVAGHQPMHDVDTGNWLVFNGEIYNFRQLRSELESRGVRFSSQTDTEVLLRAYGTWGLDCIFKLRGMFAFALWDARGGRLLLVRDPLGVKPLYYAEAGEALLFGSEVRALLKSDLVPRRLSHPGLISYLALGAVQEPHTIIDGIQSLPPGHYATWEGDRFRSQRYWSLERCYRPDRARSLEWPEAVQSVRAALNNSIRLRLVSDAPMGIFLSGGLDSSAITALAVQQSDMPLRTMSVVFAEHAFSESTHIDRVRQRYATIHTEHCLSDQDLISLLPESLGAMDQPTFDGINTYVIAREARMAGLSVALSGLGGDELFGGYPSFNRVPILRAMRRCIPVILRKPVAEALRIAGRESDQARKLARWVSPDQALNGAPETLLRELFAPDDRKRLVPGEAGHKKDGMLVNPLHGDDLFNSVSYFEMSQYLRNVLLRDTDAMGMANSIEVREPLLDQDLVELVAALPGRVKRARGGLKPLLSEVVRNDLPRAILKRRKMGFSFPFATWLRGPLGGSMEETLLDPRLGGQVAEVLDPVAVKSVVDRFRAGSGSWVRVWSLYALKQWGNHHLH